MVALPLLNQVVVLEVDVRAVLTAVGHVLSWKPLKKRGCSGFLPSVFEREGRGLESERGK